MHNVGRTLSLSDCAEHSNLTYHLRILLLLRVKVTDQEGTDYD